MRVARGFAFLFVLAAACGGTAAAPAPLFPAYTKEDASLFDDFVDPRVLGVGYDAPVVNPRSDSALFERAQIGDADPRVAAVTGQYKQLLAGRDFGAFLSELRQRYEVTINPTALQVEPR